MAKKKGKKGKEDESKPSESGTEPPTENTTEQGTGSVSEGKQKSKEKKGKKGKAKGEKGAKGKKAEYDRMREEQAKKEAQKKEERAAAKLKAKQKKEQMQKEADENEIRHDKLARSCRTMSEIMLLSKYDRETNLRAEEEWQRYLSCDVTPNPSDVQGMNYYLYRWQTEPDPETLEAALPKFDEVLALIAKLNDYVTHPINATRAETDLWKFMRCRLYHELSNKINKLTFTMMRNARQSLEPMTVMAGRIEKQTHSFAIGLYSRFHDVKPCIGETDDFELPVIVDFPALELSVYVPYQIVFEKYFVRVLWSKFDDFSILTNTYEPVPMPDEYDRDLFQYNRDEYDNKQRLIIEYAEQLKAQKKRKKQKSEKDSKGSKLIDPKETATDTASINTVDSSQEEEEGEEVISEKGSKLSIASHHSISQIQKPLTPQIDSNVLRSPSTIMLITEEENKKALASYFKQTSRSSLIVSLRKYSVLGGILHIDFFEALPQPHTLPNRGQVQVIIGERELRPIPIDVHTNHIIKQVYNKYRNRLGVLNPKAEDIKHSKAGKPNDKERIATSLARLSVAIESRLSGAIQPPEELKDKKKPVSSTGKVDINQIPSKSDHSDTASISSRRSISSRISFKSSDAYSVQSFDMKGEEEGSEEQEQSEISSEGSDDSYKSHDSTFQEFTVQRHDSCHFKPKIKMNLPKHVLWFERPFPVIWNFSHSAWYYNDSRVLFDITYEDNEEGIAKSISFRFTRIGSPVALAVRRYSPLPFTMWKLYPDLSKTPVESVIFFLETEMISLEFKIGLNTLTLNSVDIRLPYQDKNILKDLIGKVFRPIRLIGQLLRYGVDIFPDHDAYLFVKCTTSKHYVCEHHTYKCMALACTAYNFLYSKWNHLTSNKNIVMNVMECIGCSLKMTYRLCLINPQRALFLNCDENGQDFIDNDASVKFYPDLYWLLLENSCTVSVNKMKDVSIMLADTVLMMLKATKIFNYS